MIALVAGSALAQQECAEVMSRIQLGAQLGEVADALAVDDIEDADAHVAKIHERLPCLDEVVDPHLFALFARYESMLAFYRQDEEEAQRWAASSKAAEADLGWDEAVFPKDHPVRVLASGVTVPETRALGEHGLLVPRGGGMFVNGAFAPRPEALDDLPTLVQVFDKAQRRVDAGWQDGNRFPDRWLTDQPGDLPPPAWLVGGVPNALPVPEPHRPDPVPRPPGKKLPIGPIVGASALALASGASYGLATSWNGQLDDAKTVDELTATRTRTNWMVLTSGVTLAGAVGVGIGGVLLSF